MRTAYPLRKLQSVNAGIMRAIAVLPMVSMLSGKSLAQNEVQPTMDHATKTACSAQCGVSTLTTWTRVLCNVPDFGGAFVDSMGFLNVYLTDLKGADQVSRALAGCAQCGRWLPTKVRFLQADFSFRSLERLVTSLFPNFEPGIVYASIDERRNRVVIGYSADSARRHLEQVMKAIGVPLGAVLLERR